MRKIRTLSICAATYTSATPAHVKCTSCEWALNLLSFLWMLSNLLFTIAESYHSRAFIKRCSTFAIKYSLKCAEVVAQLAVLSLSFKWNELDCILNGKTKKGESEWEIETYKIEIDSSGDWKLGIERRKINELLNACIVQIQSLDWGQIRSAHWTSGFQGPILQRTIKRKLTSLKVQYLNDVCSKWCMPILRVVDFVPSEPLIEAAER